MTEPTTSAAPSGTVRADVRPCHHRTWLKCCAIRGHVECQEVYYGVPCSDRVLCNYDNCVGRAGRVDKVCTVPAHLCGANKALRESGRNGGDA
jgi:hypothetical protein